VEKLIDKISSYNIFNFFFPGAVFSALADHLGIIAPPSDKLIERLVWYYFIGLIISRIGSLMVEPILKSIKFVTYADYKMYLAASQADSQMATMVETSNTYRTIIAAFLALAVSFIVNTLANDLKIDVNTRELVLISGALILFLFSFRKQSNYISRRAEHYGGEPKSP